MTPLLSQLFRSTRPEPAPLSPVQRILSHREPLLRCALLLLDEPQAAQEVVLRSLRQALRSPLILELASTGDSEARLGVALERLLIHHLLGALKGGPESAKRGGAPLAESAPPFTDSAKRSGAPFTESAKRSGVEPGRRAADRRSGAWAQRGGARGAAPPVEGKGAQAAAELQRLQRLSQALWTLSPETRVVLVLVVVQKRPLGEVAELLGCSLECCQFWLNHGRKLLRRVLQRDLLDGDTEPHSPRTLTPPGALHELYRSKKATARA